MPLLITVLTIVSMEVVAWAAHRYIMHGWGWGWHQSHHLPSEGPFEKNDLYAVAFAILAAGLFLFASRLWPPLFWVAVGMTVYGLLYALVHDGLVHQRWPFRHRPKNAYLRRLVQAHRLHHAVGTRERCVSFGFLYAPPVTRLRDDLRRMHPQGIGRVAEK